MAVDLGNGWVPPGRFELPTPSLGEKCSSPELRGRIEAWPEPRTSLGDARSALGIRRHPQWDAEAAAGLGR